MRLHFLVVSIAAALSGCGGGGGDGPQVRVSILEPSASGTATVSTMEVRLGGTLSGAAFLEVRNLTNGTRWDGYVTYFDGHGTWMADVYGLAPGPNVLEAVADRDGTGERQAKDRIVVTRATP